MGIEIYARYINASRTLEPPLSFLTFMCIVYYFLPGQAEQPVDFGEKRGYM